MRRMAIALLVLAIVALGATACLPPGVAFKFRITGLRDQTLYSLKPIPSQVFVVEAVDSAGNVVTDYNRTVTFDGGDFPDNETLPPDTALVNGRGVFVMNVGTLQNDCHYGDVAPPDCYAHTRLTVSDKTNPFPVASSVRMGLVLIIDIPIPYITPPVETCTNCVANPASPTVFVDTEHPVLILDASLLEDGRVQGTLHGTTTTGETFNQSITLSTPVAGIDFGTFDAQVMLDVKGTTTEADPLPDLVVTNLAMVCSLLASPPCNPTTQDFGTVQVNVPYKDPTTGTTQTAVASARVHDYGAVSCETANEQCA